MSEFVVMGYPIAHSLSPRIHHAFGRLVGKEVTYERQEVAAGTLAQALAAFVAAGGRGANITVPLKAEACALADRLSGRARRAMAVNTILWEHGLMVGDNTDGVGFIRDLVVNQGLSLRDRTVLLVGAGGAAQGIAGPLLDEGVARLVIVNRTPARATQLVASLADDRAYAGLLSEQGEPFDFVINATAAGLAGAVPALPGIVFQGAVAYDLVYGARADGFLSCARLGGAKLAVDGLGMLVEQAAESFWLWHGMRPPVAPVLQALRADI
ncbi:MAG TPA: shikimate dehydrogenase [Acidiferrobacter sp.]|nr:shikimate dehydrogenase [Acidiferrobacter sp.]